MACADPSHSEPPTASRATDHPILGCSHAPGLTARVCWGQGEVRLRSHVQGIELDASGRACGVALRGGEVLTATAVVSNADAWATVGLLPEAARPPARPRRGGAPAVV